MRLKANAQNPSITTAKLAQRQRSTSPSHPNLGHTSRTQLTWGAGGRCDGARGACGICTAESVRFGAIFRARSDHAGSRGSFSSVRIADPGARRVPGAGYGTVREPGLDAAAPARESAPTAADAPTADRAAPGADAGRRSARQGDLLHLPRLPRHRWL